MSALTETDDAQEVLMRRDDGPIASLCLNRPKAYNALSIELMESLIEALDGIARDGDVKAVIVAGSGRGFCAGHDLKELRANPGRPFYEKTFQTCATLMLAITRLPQPVIAQVHGIATAAGCQLVASCDLAVAAEGALFATPGVNIGLFCSTPMVALSRSVGRKQAMEMLLLGEMVQAEKAQALGLVNKVVPVDALARETTLMAEAIAAKSPHVLRIGKEAFYRQIELGLDEAYAYTAEVMTENMLARDAEEGIDAFIEKRAPRWKGE